MSVRRGLPVALLVVLGLAVGFVGLRAYCDPGYRPVAFTAEGWSKGSAEARGRMADDLLGRHPLVGSAESEVVALLGRPDEDQREIGRFRYRLGRRGRRPDCPLTDFSLLITFDGRGRVASASVAD